MHSVIFNGLQIGHDEGHLLHVPVRVTTNPGRQLEQTVRLEHSLQSLTVQFTHFYKAESYFDPGAQMAQLVAFIVQVTQGLLQGMQVVPLKKVPLKHLEQLWALVASQSTHPGAHFIQLPPSLIIWNPAAQVPQEYLLTHEMQPVMHVIIALFSMTTPTDEPVPVLTLIFASAIDISWALITSLRVPLVYIREALSKTVLFGNIKIIDLNQVIASSGVRILLNKSLGTFKSSK